MSDVTASTYTPEVGRPRLYSQTALVALVQGLADGKTITQACVAAGMQYRTGDNALAQLRKRHAVKNTTHLVAHFLRNGWID